MYLQWMRRAAPQGEVSVYRWIPEKSPFVSAPIGDGMNIIPYKDACVLKARIFTDIWETREDKVSKNRKNGDIVWPLGLEHSDFDFSLDPEAVRRQARRFRITTCFGTDVVHPNDCF